MKSRKTSSKIKSLLNDSDIPEMVIAKLEYSLMSGELSNSDCITLLQYFQPKLTAQQVELEVDKQEPVNFTEMFISTNEN